ncbi:MAG: hypothetical protein RLY93_14000 [Sumerlaeia bacterium]
MSSESQSPWINFVCRRGSHDDQVFRDCALQCEALGLIPALSRHPVQSVEIVADLADRFGERIDGLYDRTQKTIRLNSNPDYGRNWQAGLFFAAPWAAQSRGEAIRAAFFHELGHHLTSQFHPLRRIISRAFETHSTNCMTIYGRVNESEYDCECLSLYAINPEILRGGDSGGFILIERTLSILRSWKP